MITAALIAGAAMAVQTPGVQTFLARRVVAALKKNIDGDISFSKIHFSPFNTLIINDIAIVDKSPFIPLDSALARQDTLFRAKRVAARFSYRSLTGKNSISLWKLNVDDALFVLAGETGTNNIQRIFKAAGKEGNPGAVLDKEIAIGKVELNRMEFRLVNFGKYERDKARGKGLRPFGLDWRNLDVTASLKGHGLRMKDGDIYGTVDEMSMTEKSGYSIKSITGSTRVGHGEVIVKDIKISDPWSEMDVPEYSMTGKMSAYNKYVDSVVMRGIIRDTRFDLRTLAYFAPTLKDRHGSYIIREAEVEGPVRALKVTKMDFTETQSGVSGNVANLLTGLPKAADMAFDAVFNHLDFEFKGLSDLIRSWAPSAKIDFSNIAPGHRFQFSGKGSGPISNLSVSGQLTSELGGMTADAGIRNILIKDTPIEVDGVLHADGMDLGELTGRQILGKCTGGTRLSAALTSGSPTVRLDSLSLDRLGVLGYDYTGIAAKGTYSGKAFDGKIICGDPNLNFLVQGIFTLSRKTRYGLYKFYANLGYADLKATGLDRRGSTSKASGKLNANFMRIPTNDLIGDIDVSGLMLENDQGRHDVGDIHIKSHSNNDIHRINLDSDFADCSFSGSRPFTELFRDIQALTTARELPSLYTRETDPWSGQKYVISIDMHDSRKLLSFVKPGLYIADSTRLDIDVTPDGVMKGKLKSPRIALGANYLKRMVLDVDNTGDRLSGLLTSEEMKLSALSFLDNKLSLYAHDDHVGLGYSYDNKTSLRNKGEVFLTGELYRDQTDSLVLTARIQPSNIYYQDEGWAVSSQDITLKGKDIGISDLVAGYNGQRMTVNGGFSPVHKDSLSLEMVRFDIGILSGLVAGNFNLKGTASGKAVLSSPTDTDFGILMGITCDSTSVAGRPAGTVRLTSAWDEVNRGLRFSLQNDMNGSNTIHMDGLFNPRSREIDASARLNGMDAGYIQPFLSSVFSEMYGPVSGNIRISGPLDKPELSSTGAAFDDVHATLSYTNVPYTVSGPISLAGDGLFFDNVSVKDRRNGQGTISGGLLFDHLKNPRMDTHISMNRIEAMNTTSVNNPVFYGNVYGSGNVSITGPLDQLNLAVDAETTNEGNFHISMASGNNSAISDLLTFKEDDSKKWVDPYEEMMNSLKVSGKRKTGMGIQLKVHATPQVQALLELGTESGNGLNARGEGDILLEIRPGSGQFTINGDYTLTDGNFHYNALGIVSRDFTIQNGSSIRFNGDIMESILDIDAMYTAKTSLSSLIADTTSLTTRRTVNCGINISERLRNPRLRFSIDIPDLDPTTKARVESALSTDDKLQKQFLSLLISGGFFPDDQSGIVNNTNVLYSNVAEIMASQLNNILQKLEIPLDLGLKYQANDTGTDIFDVAVSTQLFNNRVLVNGTLGNRQYGRSGSGEGMVGDLDIEIKLNPTGSLRMNLFSHSADDYTNYLDNSQRNGVGIAYQREFGNLKKFFRDLFKSRKKREEEAQAALGRETEKTVIIIDRPENE